MTRHVVRVQPLSGDDLGEVVAVHTKAFPGFYLAALGPGFLTEYYRRVLAYRGGMCIGGFVEDSLAGFVAGFVDPPAFYRELRAARVRLTFAALPSLVRHPPRIFRFMYNYRRTGRIANASQHGDPATTAELSSLAVRPDREGFGVGTGLVRAFAAEASRRGARRVVLTTDARGNDRVNRFYAGQGFELADAFEAQPGRVLNEYVMPLGAIAPLEENE